MQHVANKFMGTQRESLYSVIYKSSTKLVERPRYATRGKQIHGHTAGVALVCHWEGFQNYFPYFVYFVGSLEQGFVH